MMSVEVQAEQLKLKGNEYFKKEKLSAAIDAYTEAITLCPTVPVYWTNRAVCFKKRNDWDRVRHDCQKALELDKGSFKAHRLLGLALLHSKLYPEAIRALKKALGPNEATLGNASNSTTTTCSGRCRSGSCSGVACSVEIEHTELLNTLENVFDAAEERDNPRELPDFLCCKITMDLFRDPVITPSGITYERSVLEDHLSRGRNFDPLTRAPLEQSQLISNLAMKDAVSDFVERHGWANQSLFNPSEQ